MCSNNSLLSPWEESQRETSPGRVPHYRIDVNEGYSLLFGYERIHLIPGPSLSPWAGWGGGITSACITQELTPGVLTP